MFNNDCTQLAAAGFLDDVLRLMGLQSEREGILKLQCDGGHGPEAS